MDEKMSRVDNPPPYPGYPPGPSPSQMGGPPPPGFHPPPPVVHQPPPGVVVASPVIVPVVVGQPMGLNPATYVCRSCSSQILTRVEQRPTLRAHLFAMLFCLIGFWPCACIPYCMESCRSADHYCPNCNAYIGSYMN